jgi:hypothetical protein
MAAIAAALDVTAESGGAAALDRGHGVPLCPRQRPAMLITETRAEVAEHVRHFQSLAGHETRVSGRYQVRYGWHEDLERFQRAGGGADFAGGDHEISSRGAQIAMAEQQLDRAKIGAGLQQVDSERVAKGVRRDRLADAALLPHFPTGAIDGGWRDRLAGPVTGEQPFARTGKLPIVPEDGKQFGRQHDIAVFAAFALINPDDHALAIDRRGFEADCFGYPQTGRITDGQDHAVLQVVHGAQKARDFVLAHNDGKLFRLTAGGNILDSPWPLEGDGVEKPEGGNRDDN